MISLSRIKRYTVKRDILLALQYALVYAAAFGLAVLVAALT